MRAVSWSACLRETHSLGGRQREPWAEGETTAITHTLERAAVRGRAVTHCLGERASHRTIHSNASNTMPHVFLSTVHLVFYIMLRSCSVTLQKLGRQKAKHMKYTKSCLPSHS